MEDNKLTEFEAKMIHIVMYNKYGHGSNFNTEGFISDLRQIMPPTCTPNERKFLDEIKERGKLIDSMGCLVIQKLNPDSHEQTGFLFQSDFTKSNLSELVEKKE